MKKVYNKLVRDKIPDIIKESGAHCMYHVATGAELEEALLNKLLEEVNEFIEDPCAEEMADIQEVLWSIQEFFKLSEYDLMTTINTKSNERGSFSQGIILEHVSDN
jgi:predicted house-cleaning noncanonical NTP pyrophosphatase (MazG superfamily)